jgi:hypothetical protein
VPQKYSVIANAVRQSAYTTYKQGGDRFIAFAMTVLLAFETPQSDDLKINELA